MKITLDFKKPLLTARETGCSVSPLRFDEKLCVCCGRCAAICQSDVMMPSGEAGRHPIVLYPGECWYCGRCVMSCPTGAVTLHHPIYNETKFVRSKAAKVFTKC
ncbi:MAG: 4Fe-4S binding protein [Firmicutes bacterium]|nr:4Fe-4S binding protein [Bacillota bacterium]